MYSSACGSNGSLHGIEWIFTMQSIIWFVLLIGLVSGIGTVYEHPDGHYQTVVDEQHNLVLDTYLTPAEEFSNQYIEHQQYDYSCGAAALTTLLNYHLGENFTERQVIQGLFVHGNLERIRQRRAFSLLDMKRFVDALGYRGAGYTAELQNLRELDVPVVLPIEISGYQHFVVFRGIFDNRVFLADPWQGNTVYTVNAFEEMWYRQVIFMVEPGGRPTRNLLALTEEDMRYMDEDRVFWMLFPEEPIHTEFWQKREELRNLEPDAQIYQRR